MTAPAAPISYAEYFALAGNVDMETVATQQLADYMAGRLTVNQMRAIRDLPPVAGYDIYREEFDAKYVRIGVPK